jgi:hypothetical protein
MTSPSMRAVGLSVTSALMATSRPVMRPLIVTGR